VSSGADVDLTSPQRIHVVGIGGAGMRAIASVLAAMGHQVSGSDLKASAGLGQLRAEGVTVEVGHDASNLGDVDLVTRSTAVPDHNPEVAEAQRRGIPVASRADVLSALCHVRPTVAVAGTHGKTTTSSMLAVALTQAGFEPSFIIGAEVNEIGSGGVWTARPNGIFVVEADESDGTFLRLKARHAIVTSVEPDHLSHYGAEDVLRSAFAEFVEGVAGTTVLCVDDDGAAALRDLENVVSYGTADDADYRISEHRTTRSGASFALEGPGGSLGEFTIATPGLYNVRNATAAVAMADALGADVDDIRRGLARFAGVARRFQLRGESAGVTYVDDYAHLPTEVDSVLTAASEGGWGRVVCVFQPHRYTRTRDLWADFADSFVRADAVFITSIYAAGERPIPGVTGRLIADAVAEAHPEADLGYFEHRDELADELRSILRPGDLCLTLGAGDLTTLADDLMSS
jgi:UDP-N-acetylmuramate--alanine ligase